MTAAETTPAAPSTSGVVLVVYRPDEAAVANVAQVNGDTTQLVVVDNTPVPDTALHARWADAGITVLPNGNRGGLAGAYNRGVETLLGAGVELCFLLDQDSVIEPGYVDRMTRAADGIEAAAFLVGPRIYEIKMAAWFPGWATDDEVARRGRPLQPTDLLISSGSAVSAAAYRRLGPFAEDLFIEWIDIEYCQRAAAAEVPAYVVTSEVLRQSQGAITRHGNTFTTNHVAPRRYYHVRNGIWTGVRYEGLRRTLPGSLRLVLRECWVVARYERDKRAKITAVLVAAVDGFRGRLGAFEAVRPRTYRYCTR